MGNEDLIKIHEIKSAKIKNLAEKYGDKDDSKGISKEEAEYLQGFFTGYGLKEEDFANESDSVRAAFGYHTSPITSTEPAAVKESRKPEAKKDADVVPTALTKKERKEIEKIVASEVESLAKQGKNNEQILKALCRTHAQIVTIGDVNREPDKYTKDDIGDFKYEKAEDGTRVLLLKDGYGEVIKDVANIMGIVEESGASHQYSLMGIRTQKKYAIFGGKRQNKEYAELKDDVKEAYPEATRKFRREVRDGMEVGVERTRAKEYLETTPLKTKDGGTGVKISYEYKDKDGKTVKVEKKASTMEQLYDVLVEMDRTQNPDGVPNFKENVESVKDALKESGQWKDYDCKQAFKLLEGKAKKDARDEARADINADTESTSYKKIRKNLRKLSKDDYYRDAIQDLKQNRKNKANKNTFDGNLADIKDMSYEEVVDELDRHFLGIRTKSGKKVANKLDAYLTEGQETYAKGDNKYNLEELALGILSRVGFDYTLSRNDGDLEMAEIKNIREYLKTKTNEDFTDDQIKRLCKLSAIVIEHKDRSFKAVMSKLSFGAMAGAISQLGVLMGTSKALEALDSVPRLMKMLLGGLTPIDVLNVGINSVSISNGTSNVSQAEINAFLATKADEIRNVLDEKGAQAAKDYVQKAVQEKFGISDILQIIIQRVEYDPAEYMKQYKGDWLNKLCEYVQSQMQDAIKDAEKIETIANIVAALAPALITLAFGDAKNEKSCVSVSDYAITESKYTDIDKFKDYVDRRFGNNEDKATAMKMLADMCYKAAQDKNCKYEWHEIFNDMVREMAGYGSKLNWKECLGFQDKKFDFSKYTSSVTREEEDPDENDEEVKDECIVVKDEKEELNIQPREVAYTGWADAANGYSCLKDYNRSVVNRRGNKISLNRRMVKVIQAMKIDHITTSEDYRTFYDITKIAAFAEESIKNGYDSANAKYPELHVDKQEYLDLLRSEIGVKSVVIPELYNPNHEEGDDGFCGWVKPQHVSEGMGGKGSAAVISRKDVHADGSVSYEKLCKDSKGNITRTPSNEDEYNTYPHEFKSNN